MPAWMVMYGVLVASGTRLGPQQPALAFDHVWIVVAPGAPERTALERAGFVIAPGVNRHDGQGTASVTVEFDNAFLELLWPDSSVRVTPGLEVVAERFRRRMAWRTSGWPPIGIGLVRMSAALDSLPFPTWSARADWQPAGEALEMLTPRGDSLDPTLWIVPRATVSALDDPQALRSRAHASGVHRVTHVRLTGPRAGTSLPTRYVGGTGAVEFVPGAQWLLELTFDSGARGKVVDLRPQLPLVLRM